MFTGASRVAVGATGQPGPSSRTPTRPDSTHDAARRLPARWPDSSCRPDPFSVPDPCSGLGWKDTTMTKAIRQVAGLVIGRAKPVC